MLKHYFTSAFRSIWRNRLYSVIIILSLSIGFSFITLLAGYNIHELNTDDFHSHKNQIFRVFTDDPFGDREQFSSIPFKATDYLNEHYPEIIQTCKIYDLNNQTVLSYQDETAGDLKIIATTESFFELFNFPRIGKYDQAIKPGQIVLSQAAALKLTGQERPLNFLIEVNIKEESTPLIVSGIMEQLPENSHLKFDAVVHFDDFLNQQNSGSCYILLDEKASVSDLEQKINQNANIAKPFDKAEVRFHLQNLKDTYFDNTEPRRHQVVGNFSLLITNQWVAVFIIIISLYNFISLYSLYTKTRWKEFGIRKTLGGNKGNFLAMVFVEVFILIAISCLLTCLSVSVIHNKFTQVFQVSFPADYYIRYELILIFFSLLVLVSLSFLIVFSQKLSAVKPIGLLKTLKPVKSGNIFSMFTLQYSLTIGLIIASLIFMKQIHFIKNKPLGFDRHLVQVMPPDKSERNKLPAYKQQLLMDPIIEKVSLCSGNPISDNIVIMDKLANGEMYTSYLFLGDKDYLNTVGFELDEGIYQESRKGVYINQQFVRYLDLKDPVGSFLPNSDREILGVIKDFNIYSLKKEIPNVIVKVEPDQPMVMVNYQPNQLNHTISSLEQEWKQIFQSKFRYKVVDHDLLQRHDADLALFNIIMAFMIGSLLLANFGLFAFSWNAVHHRSKEIAIRKVVGSGLTQIFYLLNQRLIISLILSFTIAAPVAYYMMQKWLRDFAFKTEIGWWIFALAGGIALLITFLTVSFQTIKAALANPVEALRNE